jgi:hypothetical protein
MGSLEGPWLVAFGDEAAQGSVRHAAQETKRRVEGRMGVATHLQLVSDPRGVDGGLVFGDLGPCERERGEGRHESLRQRGGRERPDGFSSPSGTAKNSSAIASAANMPLFMAVWLPLIFTEFKKPAEQPMRAPPGEGQRRGEGGRGVVSRSRPGKVSFGIAW